MLLLILFKRTVKIMSIPSALPFTGCRRVSTDSLPIPCTTRTFALRMEDDSMRGRGIIKGDILVLEHGLERRPGDVVAALVEGESVVRTYTFRLGRPMLEASHPSLGRLVPADGLVIQGVMTSLIRHRKG